MGKNAALGLDIGSSSLKIVQLQRAGNRIVMQQYGSMRIPFGSLEGGAIQNPEVVADHIRRLMSELRIRAKEAAIAVAGQTVIVRHVKFPLMDKKELAEGIKWEAERYIPYPIDDASVDFEIVSRDESNNEMEVMLVAAQKQLIESHIDCLKLAGIQPIAIDVQPFALIRSLGLLDTPSSKTIVILDIGAGTTDLIIFKTGTPRFTRIIPIAGIRLTKTVADSFGCSMEEAEQKKVKYGDAIGSDGEDHSVQVYDAIKGALDELVLEIRRSIDYYKLQQRDEDVDQMIVVGGGARLRNIEAFLSRELGIRVVKGNPLQLLSTSNENDELMEDAPVLSVGVGLALREVE